MEELEFIRHLESNIKRYYESKVIITPFLDEHYGALLEDIANKNGVIYYKDGGIINSERNRYILSLFDVNKSDFKINIYKVKYNKKYYDISHRNILGSLMSLGIKRECIGDIIVDDDIYIAITEEISSFIEAEFKYVGKAPIELELYKGVVEATIKYDEKKDFVTSLRLDLIVSTITNISRSKSQEILQNKDVMVNYIINQNPSYQIKDNDIISVRHYGKYKIELTDSVSRSGKYLIKILKRVWC